MQTELYSQINEIGLNPNSLIKNEHPIDYYDVFQLRSSKIQQEIVPQQCVTTFFQSFPPVFYVLIAIRNILVLPFRLKRTSGDSRAEFKKKLEAFRGEKGERISLFKVIARSQIEILTGESDRHLDFRLSFLTYREEDQTVVEIATTVRYNNNLGRLYFFVVKPFHKYLVKATLKRMETRLICRK